jgi:hypothetical protein
VASLTVILPYRSLNIYEPIKKLVQHPKTKQPQPPILHSLSFQVMVVDKKCVIPSYMKQQIMVVEMGVLFFPFVHVVALVYTILVFVKFATNR